MAYEIEWTEPALDDLQKIFEYLEKNWSIEIADRFIEVTKDKLVSLTNHPFKGQRSAKKPQIRSIIISKYNKLYYQIDGEVLTLLRIMDMRQDPDKNPY